jgi:hypothetical protein
MTDEPFEPTTISQTRGLSHPINGRKIAETTFETKGHRPLSMALELWETEAGCYIAVTDAEPVGGGFADTRTAAFAIGEPDPRQPWITFAPTEEARQWHVMQFFGWDQRAMKMARKQLGWNFVREID